MAAAAGCGAVRSMRRRMTRAVLASMPRSMPARRSLRSGGDALDAVEAAARILEDDPAFNAGRGSVLAFDGHVELDAAIMDGRDAGCRRGRRGADDARTDQPRPGGDGA